MICSDDVAALPNKWVIVTPRSVKVYNKEFALAYEFITIPRKLDGLSIGLCSVTIQRNGNVLVGDVERMVLTEHNHINGSLLRTIPVEIKPEYLAVMNDGRIVISSPGERPVIVVNVTNDSATTEFVIKPITADQPRHYCTGVCCNNSGIYVVVDSYMFGRGHIHHYDCKGKFVRCVAQGLYHTGGMTFTADGQQLAVADVKSVKMFGKM